MDFNEITYKEFDRLLKASDRTLDKMLFVFGFTTDKELAQELGVSHKAISNVRASGKIPERWLNYMAARFGVCLRAFLTFSYGEMVAHSSDAWRMRQLSFLDTTMYRLGGGQEFGAYIKGYFPLRRDIARAYDLRPNEAAIVYQNTMTSMEPTIRRDSFMLLALDRQYVLPGSVYAVGVLSTGEQFTCRVWAEDTKLFRLSFDASDAKNMIVDRDDVRIYGQVLGCSNRL